MYPQECFIEDHCHVNINTILLSDILQQLYKRIVTNFVDWLTKSILKKYKSIQIVKKKGHTRELKLGQIHNLTQLDERFQKISLFTDLKLFRYYSKVV